ncbi:MAG: hypothetical protein OHK0039_33370 [Bacteroidia bacterium]
MSQIWLLLLFAFIILQVMGFVMELFGPPAEEKKKDKPTCSNCGVPVAEGEKTCFYCEIIDYRKWKRDEEKKKK